MFVFLFFLGLLPSLIWLSFFLQEDIHPEPRKMIFWVFIGGVVGAVGAVFCQNYFQSFLEINHIIRDGFYPILGFAFLEEFFKFLAAFLIVRKSKYFDEPIDAMVYMLTAAAGMAAVENVSIMFNQEIMSERIGILIFRFLGATLLHVLSSSIVGYHWAKGIVKNRVLAGIFTGLVLATLLHAFFNYFIMVFSGGIIYSIILLAVVAFFVFYYFENLKKDGPIKTS